MPQTAIQDCSGEPLQLVIDQRGQNMNKVYVIKWTPDRMTNSCRQGLTPRQPGTHTRGRGLTPEKRGIHNVDARPHDQFMTVRTYTTAARDPHTWTGTHAIISDDHHENVKARTPGIRHTQQWTKPRNAAQRGVTLAIFRYIIL